MTIVHVASYRPTSPNGVFVAVAALVNELARQGVPVEVWHFRRAVARVTERDVAANLRVVELPLEQHPVVRSKFLRRVPPQATEWIAARQSDIRAFHFHSVFQPESWSLADLTDTPYCVTPHGGLAMFERTSAVNLAKWPLWQVREGPFMRGARFIHAVSAGDAESVRRRLSSVPVETVPNGVEIPSSTAEWPGPAAPWVFIGRLDVRTKGLDLLLRGYASLSPTLRRPLRINGPDFRGGRAELDRLVRKLELDRWVTIGEALDPTHRNEVLNNCALFLQPSRNEGLPSGVLEAMAHGRPVAVTPGTNIADVVAQARCGFVIDGARPDAIAAALARAALTSDSDLASAGARGRAIVSSRFSWALVTAALVELYDRYFPPAV